MGNSFKAVGRLSMALMLVLTCCSAVQAYDASITVDSISFKSAGQQLETLNNIEQEVFMSDREGTLDIQINGGFLGKEPRPSGLLAIVLPTLEQIPLKIETEATKGFASTLMLVDPPIDQPVQILLYSTGSEEAKNESPAVISFILRSEGQYPELSSVISEISSRSGLLVFLFLLTVASLIMVIRGYRREGTLARVLSVTILIMVLLLFAYQMANIAIESLLYRGLLQMPESTLVLQKKSPQPTTGMTLNRLNENLELEPSLSTGWSNISPRVWEFFIRPDSVLTPVELIAAINKEKVGPGKPYLSSVESIITVNHDRLQFITSFPDPLLAQKLSKIDLTSGSSPLSNITDEYLVRSEFAAKTQSIRNPDYVGLPFLSHSSLFKTELITSDLDELKKIIASNEVTLFDEPETALWPTLSQHGYQIQPKINSKSAMIMLNRKNPTLKNLTLIAALTRILKSPRILQTSYFQYGRLASQFAPPGVVGYDPTLQLASDVRPVPELVAQAMAELETEKLSLKFSFPSEEQVLAGVIRKELEKAGISVIPDDLDPELTLMTVDFELGDVGPFLDAMIDSNSSLNTFYKNDEVDELIAESRSELNSFNRLQLLQRIMKMITIDDPAGIPLLFKKSFIAKKKPVEMPWYQRWYQLEARY